MKAISRVSRSAVITKKILTSYDKVMKVFHQSGKPHKQTFMMTFSHLNTFMSEEVFSFIPGRSYIGLQDVAANPFRFFKGLVIIVTKKCPGTFPTSASENIILNYVYQFF